MQGHKRSYSCVRQATPGTARRLWCLARTGTKSGDNYQLTPWLGEGEDLLHDDSTYQQGENEGRQRTHVLTRVNIIVHIAFCIKRQETLN